MHVTTCPAWHRQLNVVFQNHRFNDGINKPGGHCRKHKHAGKASRVGPEAEGGVVRTAASRVRPEAGGGVVRTAASRVRPEAGGGVVWTATSRVRPEAGVFIAPLDGCCCRHAAPRTLRLKIHLQYYILVSTGKSSKFFVQIFVIQFLTSLLFLPLSSSLLHSSSLLNPALQCIILYTKYL